ncbi:MAG: sugar ABC transporter permease, partial [Trichococcus flocculiformis]
MFKKKSYGQQMTFRELFKEGDVATKLSFVVMGAANLANKQHLKGLIFLFSQIAFFYWLIRNGLRALSMLATLGTQSQGLVFDERLGIEVL